MILPNVILMDIANVSTMTPKSNVNGSVSPNLCPKLIQLSHGTPFVACAMKLPMTIPANTNKNKAQLFFPAPRAITIPPVCVKVI